MKNVRGHGAGNAAALAFATLPLMVMSWVAYESALISFA